MKFCLIFYNKLQFWESIIFVAFLFVILHAVGGVRVV